MSTERNSLTPRDEPKKAKGITQKIRTGCGYLYVTINNDEQGPCEVFATLEKIGGCVSAQLEAICRLISVALRGGIKYEVLIKQLRGIRCPAIAWEESKAVLSCADAIAMVLEENLKLGNKQDDSAPKLTATKPCPECGGELKEKEGCLVCSSCGYTKC